MEEAAEAVIEERERGVIKRWNEDKGFGFIGRDNGEEDAFCHTRECGGIALPAGQAVSFVCVEGPKGPSAKNVQAEEGGFAVAQEPEAEREMGVIKRWTPEKGFGFIGRDNGGEDAFCHKKDCDGEDLEAGQRVSFVCTESAKGPSASKVQKEEGGILIAEEDEGEREFGKVKQYNEEKGFAFIVSQTETAWRTSCAVIALMKAVGSPENTVKALLTVASRLAA